MENVNAATASLSVLPDLLDRLTAALAAHSDALGPCSSICADADDQPDGFVRVYDDADSAVIPLTKELVEAVEAVEDPSKMWASLSLNCNDRDELIEFAVKYLGATAYASYTRYGYTDEGVDSTVWLVTDDDMADLGRRLADGQPDAYSRWCSETTASTTTAKAVVDALPECHTEGLDIDGLCEAAGAAADYLTCAACDHLRREILAFV